ncbi:putative hexosyltransferase MUCI70 isoform X2 [Capsicum chacoense]
MGVYKSLDQIKNSRRGRNFSVFTNKGLLFWVFILAVLCFISLAAFALGMHFHVKLEHGMLPWREMREDFIMHDVPERPTKKPRRQRFFPCDVVFRDSVDLHSEPKDFMNFTQFSLGYMETEKKASHTDAHDPRFGGHQTLEEREQSFSAVNQTIHCGFLRGAEGLPSTGFDLKEEDKRYMSACRVVVSSCIFGSSDFLRRPTSRLISEYSKKNVCFVMFVDEGTLSTLSKEGSAPDDGGFVGLWKLVVVKNLPYTDTRKTGKVPKFLTHRLFPSSRYSIWLDSKLRLSTDPMLIIDHFLWQTGSEYAISNHYTRHCVWEEVLQNKRLNKYNHTAIDEQFSLYQSDGLTKFDPLDPNPSLPSYVPEGSFIVRAHTPMSNLFSCLWFNEVDRFTSRDQLSFAFTFLKLKRMNPDKPFHLNMFKDCERRSLVKLFHHREPSAPPPPRIV